jgi:RHS repeat-associated protein
VETETGNIQKNRYDAEGLRYELIENGRHTSFVYHNGELLHERGEEAGLSKEATSYHLGAGIEAFQRDSKTYYYHQDEQLNTTLITDEERKLKNHYQYDAFGAGLDAIEALPNRIRYAGQQYDEQTEQYYLRARYYNSALGRFMQEDVYQGDGLNLYAYCHNNPVIYYDPSGCYEATKNLFRNMVLLNKKTSSTDLTKAMFLTLTNKKTGPSVECYQAQHIIPKEFQNNYVLSISGYQVDHAENGIFDIDGSKPKTNTLRQYLAASGCSTEDIDKYVSDLTHHGSGKHDSGYHKAYSEYVETKLMQLDKKYGLSEKMEMQTGSESNKRKAVRNQLIASGEMELLRSDLLTLNNYLRNKNQSGIDLYYKHSNNMTTKDYTIGGLVTPEVVAKYRKGNFDDDIDLYSKEELKSEGCGSV